MQSVLLDEKSIVVVYDFIRGEKRGNPKRNSAEDLGDCIDCDQCVDVCPTGIDIRNGTQLDCVNCTACIDACDEIMDTVGYDKGLIRYTSENNIETGEKFSFNARIISYSIIFLVVPRFIFMNC